MTEHHFFSHYCERISTGLWAEPVNAITNLAFLAAALLALRLYRSHRTTDVKSTIDLKILIVLLFCITIGSTLWHTIARPWAELADSIPILLFISVYLVSFLWRILQRSSWFIVAVFVLFQFANNAVIFLFPRNILNGSLFYVPTWISLCIFTVILRQRGDPASKSFLLATMLFSAALVFRTIDEAVCSTFPIGTHFIWHILIATVLYLVFVPLLRPSYA